VLSISPNGAPADGNLTVLVLGSRFDDFGDVQCRFGGARVPARFHHRGAITCVAPPALALCHWQLPVGSYARAGDYGRVAPRYADAHAAREAGCWGTRLPTTAAVEVSFNGVDFTTGSLASFSWYNRSALEASLSALRPSAGPVRGGTLVTIHGKSFMSFGGGVQGCRCQFGAAVGSPVVDGTCISMTTMACVSPPRPRDAPPTQLVFVTLNGYADSRTLAGLDVDGEGGRLAFRYDAADGWGWLSSVHPLGGPTAGGSAVTLTAAGGFADSSATPLCLFGRPPLEVPARLRSNRTLLTCRAPSASELRGRGLRPPGAWCANLGGETAPCTDAAYAEDGVLAVALAVSLNGNASDASTNAVPWLFFGQPPRLQYSVPAGGPAVGSTLVDIVGHGLLDFGGVLCRFSQPHARGAFNTPAVFAGGISVGARDGAPLITRVPLYDVRNTPEVDRQTARTIRCRSPPLRTNATDGGARFDLIAPPEALASPLATAVLSLSLDGGQHFTSGPEAQLDWTYATPVPSGLTPRGGPRDGGTRVTVTGVGFLPLYSRELLPTTHSKGVLCAFEGSEGSGGVLVAGTVGHRMGMSGSVVVCVSPPRASRSDGSGSIAGSDTSTSSVGSASSSAAGNTTGAPSNFTRPLGTPVRVSLNGDPPAPTDPSAAFFYFNAGLIVSSIDPQGGPAAGGTAVTIYGSSHGGGFVDVGDSFCRFGGLSPAVRAHAERHEILEPVQEGLRAGTSSMPPRFTALVCRSPPHTALRATPSSEACNGLEWWTAAPSCGSVEAMPLEITLSVDDPIEYSGSGVTFTYSAYLANPFDNLLAPPPPPPPPSTPPPPPSPSPPPPGPMDCNDCDAGEACGMCLMLLPAPDCPDDADLSACDAAALEALCEGDGECGTDTNANNCGDGFDVYRRVSCYPAHPAPREDVD